MQREKSGGGREGSRVSIVFFFLFFESSFLGFHLLCFFLCLCVLFFLEIEMFKEEENCVRTKKKARQKTRAFRSSDDIKNITTPVYLFFGREGVLLLLLCFCWRRKRGEERLGGLLLYI